MTDYGEDTEWTRHRYVYVLLRSDHQKFKVGISWHPWHRHRELQGGPFDLANSLTVRGSDEAMQRLERRLLRSLPHHSPEPFVGGTEWFDDAAFEFALLTVGLFILEEPSGSAKLFYGVRHRMAIREKRDDLIQWGACTAARHYLKFGPVDHAHLTHAYDVKRQAA